MNSIYEILVLPNQYFIYNILYDIVFVHIVVYICNIFSLEALLVFYF